MLAPRVLLIWEHPFLRDAVKALLDQAHVNLLAEFNFKVSEAEIRSYSPTHILVESNHKNYQKLIAPLLEQEGVTIIRLSLENNQLQVIQRRDQAVNHPSDLLDWLGDQSITASS